MFASNEPGTRFAVDGEPVGGGTRVEMVMSDRPHEVVAQVECYRPKRVYLQPPYYRDFPYEFVFTLQEREVSCDGVGPASDYPDPSPGGVYTLAVGVGAHRDASLSLKYAQQDAIAVHQVFAGSESRSHVLLTNAAATRANVLTSLAELGEQSGSGDLVLVFLALHGLVDDSSKELYLLTHEADPGMLIGTGLSHHDLVEALRRIRARHVVVFIDACHAGLTGAPGIRGVDWVDLNGRVKNILDAEPSRVVVAASRGNERSYEDDAFGGGHGAFTAALLDAFAGAADVNNDKIVALGEIVDHAQRMVPELTRQRQHLAVNGLYDHDLAIHHLAP